MGAEVKDRIQWWTGWRDAVWSQLDEQWDVIIVGGGITGAGVLNEAVRAGYKALLVEAQDFAGGTSSRSSKLVHGGFRYMANGQFKLTYESVHERERLLRDGLGLINKLDIMMPSYPHNKVPGWALGFGLGIYSLMAGTSSYRHLGKGNVSERCPDLRVKDLLGGFLYYDANTDDARLTLRVIREAVSAGGTALNYARAGGLLRKSDGQVCGVMLEDINSPGKTAEVQASLVINATGAWADELRGKMGREKRLRPLQGSHLILPFSRLPVKDSVSIFHPRDGRPVFTLPWEGVTLVGTTDLDAGHTIPENPAIHQNEVEYLLEFLRFAYPGLEITEQDVLCTMSGIRPVIDTGKDDPSKESREHAIWLEDNLLTVTGGKLTTFRVMARDILKVAERVLGGRHTFDPNRPLFTNSVSTGLTNGTVGLDKKLRLVGRYGVDFHEILEYQMEGGQDSIGATPYLWSELRWTARNEGVVHLDDLLLRRVRIGLLLPEGARSLLPRIREIVQPELGWDDEKWDLEAARYLEIWDEGNKLK